MSRDKSGLLLDTHVILWLLEDVSIGKKAKELIFNSNFVYFSIASLWELSIKANLRKIELSENFEEQIIESGLIELSINISHIKHLRRAKAEDDSEPLSKSKTNKDPFDQMLVAQALVEELNFITADKQLLSLNSSFIDARQ